jgi:hypothetical protein
MSSLAPDTISFREMKSSMSILKSHASQNLRTFKLCLEILEKAKQDVESAYKRYQETEAELSTVQQLMLQHLEERVRQDDEENQAVKLADENEPI